MKSSMTCTQSGGNKLNSHADWRLSLSTLHVLAWQELSALFGTALARSALASFVTFDGGVDAADAGVVEAELLPLGNVPAWIGKSCKIVKKDKKYFV